MQLERIHGKHSLPIEPAALLRQIARYDHVLVDIGAGDGRFVCHIAHAHPGRFVIGIDACRENLRASSRRAPDNALFFIANALALPPDLANIATHLTINFPWGTLLTGLLDGDTGLLSGLARLACPGATLELRLNGDALAEAGWPLEAGGARVRQTLRAAGFAPGPAAILGAAELRAVPTTWAHRLAFGRDPRALYLTAARLADVASQPSLVG
ncbi:MAG TPA: class I SAM-dependent methyltransferase [Ktedonobacterales bacterium]|nr:class I SAM-dependent methyltransferase [Ktedonobacterales bacterium]